MTTTKDLPEEAQQEPRTLSPDEDTERALKRLEVSSDLEGADEALSLADADSPLRIPGELSSKPRERAHEDGRRAGAAPDPKPRRTR